MATVKVIEVLTESTKGWEDAAQNAVAAAGRSVRNIESVYIKEMQASVKDGQISSYRINAKVSFTIED